MPAGRTLSVLVECAANDAYSFHILTARAGASETARARRHTPLKTKHALPVAFMRSRRARARCATHLPRAAEQRPSSHIATPQARTNGRAPSRSRQLEARPSAGNHHHRFCLTTTHHRQARASDDPPTVRAHDPPIISIQTHGSVSLRKIFSDSCLKKFGLI